MARSQSFNSNLPGRCPSNQVQVFRFCSSPRERRNVPNSSAACDRQSVWQLMHRTLGCGRFRHCGLTPASPPPMLRFRIRTVTISQVDYHYKLTGTAALLIKQPSGAFAAVCAAATS